MFKISFTGQAKKDLKKLISYYWNSQNIQWPVQVNQNHLEEIEQDSGQGGSRINIV